MPNILVTGANGQLGSELRVLNDAFAMLNYRCFFTDKNTLDITDKNLLENFCTQHDIDIIINCAAYTAVDKAEEDEEAANRINHHAVEYLAEIAKVQSIKLIHISTDYVFDGTNYKPYTEEDPVCPVSVYGKTKLAGEKAIESFNPPGAIIIRTSWVYSSFGNNFVKTMLRLGKERDELGVIFDQVGTPTYARDLAQAILEIVPQANNQKIEIYNYANEGVTSWYDFAKAIFELSHTGGKVNAIETSDYPTPAKRPHYSLLNKSKIKETFGISIPYWKDSLKECLQMMGGIKHV